MHQAARCGGRCPWCRPAAPSWPPWCQRGPVFCDLPAVVGRVAAPARCASAMATLFCIPHFYPPRVCTRRVWGCFTWQLYLASLSPHPRTPIKALPSLPTTAILHHVPGGSGHMGATKTVVALIKGCDQCRGRTSNDCDQVAGRTHSRCDQVAGRSQFRCDLVAGRSHSECDQRPGRPL